MRHQSSEPALESFHTVEALLILVSMEYETNYSGGENIWANIDMICREKEAKQITSAIGADTLAAPSAPASFGHAGVAEAE